MRMTDSLFGEICGIDKIRERGYGKSAFHLAKTTNVENWRIVFDSHQRSTHEVGKSSCAFFFYIFQTLTDAIDVIQKVRQKWPTVNIEMFITPDGRLDGGDGPGSYDENYAHSQITYVPKKGFSVSVLVDAQNIERALT